ncbi:tRNA pseudouridine synthase, partial [Planoprotostelium fungivorum]
MTSNNSNRQRHEKKVRPSLTAPSPQFAGINAGFENKLKRRFALVTAYCGTSYNAVEGEIMIALQKAGLVKPSNTHPKQLGWNRSSRTDRGVHAIKMVVSMKLEMDGDTVNRDPAGLELSERINAHLPDDVRIAAALKVPRPFDGRRACVQRTYKYLLPARYIRESNLTLPELEQTMNYFLGTHTFHNFCGKRTPTLESMQRARDTRSPSDVHIYEEGANDESSDSVVTRREYKPNMSREEERDSFVGEKTWVRTIREFSVAGPVEVSGGEWYVFTITSNSFLYSMIRKIMTCIIAVLKGIVPPLYPKVALDSPFHFAIPLAPGEFLYLSDNVFSLSKDSGALLPYVNVGLHLDYTREQRDIYETQVRPVLEKLREKAPAGTVEGRTEAFERDVLLPHIASLDRDGDLFRSFDRDALWYCKNGDWEELLPLYYDFEPKYESIVKRREEMKKMKQKMKEESSSEGS